MATKKTNKPKINKPKTDSVVVIQWLKSCKSKEFTTGDVVDHFGVSMGSAAALIAILRIKEVITPNSPAKTEDGTSRWVFTG